MAKTQKDDMIITVNQLAGAKASKIIKGISRMPIILLIKNITKIYWPVATSIPEIHPISFRDKNFPAYIVAINKIDNAMKL